MGPSARFQYRWMVDRPSRSAAAALGLGGFPHFAAHPFIWFQALGFRMEQVPSSKLMGVPPPGDLPVPVAIGLEREGTCYSSRSAHRIRGSGSNHAENLR